MEELLSVRLPPLRVKPSMKRRLERITARGIARDVADHRRYALEKYLAEQEALLGITGEEEPPDNNS